MSPVDSFIDILTMTGQLVAVLNPIGVLPMLSTLTTGMRNEQLVRIYRLVMLTVPTLMIIFAVAGRYILEAFGVDLNAFRIAGGVLLIAIAIDTLRTGMPKAGESSVEEFVLVPIVTPLLVGPGTITTLILFSAIHPIYEVVIASIISAAATYLIIRLSGLLLSRLGANFLALIGRFMSLIIAALAVDMMLTGVSNYVKSILQGTMY